LQPPLFSQSFRMRTAYTSQASLNILWFQILFELLVAHLHFRLPDPYFVQLQTEISGDFLSSGLRKCSYCKETNEQQSARNSIYKSFHFHPPFCHLLALQPRPISPEEQDADNYQYKNLATVPVVAVLDELFEKRRIDGGGVRPVA
jgi:hypothetical protein